MHKKHYTVKVSANKLVRFELPAESERDAIKQAYDAISEHPELYFSLEAKEEINVLEFDPSRTGY